jgi:hypothetical protein
VWAFFKKNFQSVWLIMNAHIFGLLTGVFAHGDLATIAPHGTWREHKRAFPVAGTAKSITHPRANLIVCRVD